jgi:hypothetical protein
MEIEQLRQEINQLLDNVVKHSNNYNENRSIPSLEIKFILSKVNKLQESMVILKYLLEEQENKAKKSSSIIKESAPEIIIGKIEESIAVKVETIVVEKIEVESIDPPINKSTKTVEDSLKLKPIKILIDAFSLNDRYLFANELFNKDMSAFNSFIKSIDNCNSLDEAKEIIAIQNWDYENERVLSLLSLVERRFL